jgi:hypothetical protein
VVRNVLIAVLEWLAVWNCRALAPLRMQERAGRRRGCNQAGSPCVGTLPLRGGVQARGEGEQELRADSHRAHERKDECRRGFYLVIMSLENPTPSTSRNVFCPPSLVISKVLTGRAPPSEMNP